MNKEQYLLAKLAEEAVEVAQMAIKCQHLGLYGRQTEIHDTNIHRLHRELNDMEGILRMMNEEIQFRFSYNEEEIQNKINKVREFAEYSKSLGLVNY